jgi:hypothetical protein
MPRKTWSAFTADAGKLHLVVAGLPVDLPVGSPDVHRAQSVLLRYLRHQEQIGEFATTINRQGMKPEIQFAFGREGDARMLADAIQAETTSSGGGWASERAVDLKMAALDAISARLPRPRPSGRSPA